MLVKKESLVFIIYLYIKGFHVSSLFILKIIWYVLHPSIQCLIFHFNLIFICIKCLPFALESSYSSHGVLQTSKFALRDCQERGKPALIFANGSLTGIRAVATAAFSDPLLR